jgi:hypothetical protein
MHGHAAGIWLITMRLFQALGAAMLMANSSAILTTSNTHGAGAGVVPEVAMATCLANLNPPLTLEFLDDVSNLHDDTTVGGASTLDQIPVHVRLSSNVETATSNTKLQPSEFVRITARTGSPAVP